MKCSIIIPCYKQAEYLSVAVNSVLNQTYTSYEIIIVDDGSPDDSYAIAAQLAEKDERIKVYTKQNGGLASARNFGIERATGEVILPLDADDKIAPIYLEKAMPYFESNSNDLIVYSNANFFGTKTGAWKLSPYSVQDLCLYNMIFCSAFFRKSSWQKVGGYDTKMKFGWEDWDFWLSLVSQGAEVFKIEEDLFYYFTKQNSMLTGMTTEHKYYSFNYIWNKHRTFIAEHIANPMVINYEKHLLQSELNQLRESKAFKLSKTVAMYRKEIADFFSKFS